MGSSFKCKNALFSLLEKGEEYDNAGKVQSYKGIVLDKEYTYVANLKIAFSEFKEEFQINHVGEHVDKYIRLLNKDLEKIIKELNLYFETHIEPLIKSCSQEEEKVYVLFWTIHFQKAAAEDVFKYINNDFTEERALKELGRIKSVDLIKVNFNGQQIDLVLLFWCLQNAGLISFTSRVELSKFMENHFNFKIKDKYKAMKSTDIESVISKIAGKTFPKDSGPFPYDVAKDKLFELIDESLDDLQTKITAIKTELNMPPTSKQDKLPKSNK